MTAKGDLTRGPVGRRLFRVSAPMAPGIMGVLSVGLADAFFLARDGANALAAIGFVFPVIVALTSLSVGLAAGTTTMVSQGIGRGVTGCERARMMVHAVTLAAVLAMIVALAFWILAPWIFMLMGARGATLSAALDYVPWWGLSFPPMVAGMALNATCRAAGRSGIAGTVMSVQALLNVALDPVFIFGLGPLPAMGIEGAGLATFAARLAAFAGLMIFAVWMRFLHAGVAPFRGAASSARRIARVGVPAALSNMINPLGMAFITAMVARLGDPAVAGFGAAGRVQTLLLVPMLALSSGLAPVVGQAWGAGLRARAGAALARAMLWSAGIGLALAVTMLFAGGPVARLMTGGDGAAPYAAQYLRVASWGFFAYGILVTANAALNARDLALWTMALTVLRVFGLYLPMVWAGMTVAGYGGLLMATVLANLLGAAAAVAACRRSGLLGPAGRDGEVAATDAPARATRAGD